jgi:hypothetical protein
MGSKERCDEFERQARLNLSGNALLREIESFRKYLYKHQDETLSRFPSVFAAVMAHSLNPSILQEGTRGSDSILLGLLDDCLALPERVITGPQKMKILSKREKELGRCSIESSSVTDQSSVSSRQVIDVNIEENSLSYLDDDGKLHSVVWNSPLLRDIEKSLDDGNDVVVTVNNHTNTILSIKE